MPRTRKKRTKRNNRNKRKTKNRKKRTRKIQKGGMPGFFTRVANMFRRQRPQVSLFGYIAQRLQIDITSARTIDVIRENLQNPELSDRANPVYGSINFFGFQNIRTEGTQDANDNIIMILNDVRNALPNFYNSSDDIQVRIDQINQYLQFHHTLVGRYLDTTYCSMRYRDTSQISGDGSDHGVEIDVEVSLWTNDAGIERRLADILMLEQDFLNYKIRILADPNRPENYFNGDKQSLAEEYINDFNRRRQEENMRNEQAARELDRMEDQNSKEELIGRIDDLPSELAERSAGCRIKRFAEDVKASLPPPCSEANHSRTGLIRNVHPDHNSRCNELATEISQWNSEQCQRDVGDSCTTFDDERKAVANDYMCKFKNCDTRGLVQTPNGYVEGWKCGVEPLPQSPEQKRTESRPPIPPLPRTMPPEFRDGESKSSNATALTVFTPLVLGQPLEIDMSERFGGIGRRPPGVVCRIRGRQEDFDDRTLRQIARCPPSGQESSAYVNYISAHSEAQRRAMWARFVNTIPRGLSSGLQFRADNPPQEGPFALPPFTNFLALTDIPEPAEEIKQPKGVQSVLATIEDEDEDDAMTGSNKAEEATVSSSENEWAPAYDAGDCRGATNGVESWLVTRDGDSINQDQAEEQCNTANHCTLHTDPKTGAAYVGAKDGQTEWHGIVDQTRCSNTPCIREVDEKGNYYYVDEEGNRAWTSKDLGCTGEIMDGRSITNPEGDSKEDESIGAVAAARAEAEEETKETKEAVLDEIDKSLLALEAFMQTEDCPSLSPQDMDALF